VAELTRVPEFVALGPGARREQRCPRSSATLACEVLAFAKAEGLDPLEFRSITSRRQGRRADAPGRAPRHLKRSLRVRALP